MAKPPQRKKQEQIETEPDAWDRFTKAVKKMKRPIQRKQNDDDKGKGNDPRRA